MTQRPLPNIPRSETANEITAHLLIQIPKRIPGCRIWRRNVGSGVGWDTIRQVIGMLRAGAIQQAIALLQSRVVRFGVHGEPDLQGIVTISGIGCLFGIEVKAGRDRMSDDQVAFREMLVGLGGIFVEARDAEAAITELIVAIEGKSNG